MKVCLTTTDSTASRYIAEMLLEHKYCTTILVDTFEDRRNRPQSLSRKIRKHYMRGGLLDLFLLLKSYFGIGVETGSTIENFFGPVPSWSELKERHDVDIKFVSNINNATSDKAIKAAAPDLGILYGGRIIEPAILAIPRLGFINKHSSLLPKQRGPQAEFWTLYKEELESLGVTIHEVTPGLDAGAILLQENILFEDGDTPQSLREKSHILGGDLLIKTIRLLESGNVNKIIQDEAAVSVNGMPSLSQLAALKKRLPGLWEKTREDK
ncbi:hypothetical protein MNBD_GAMMA15-1144 [hydrothermal vent metagenome]|uniref:Formyl transferase N-terminal domain-containing protein n=1 Tax=hydrothermal vent metagenome TaxID=652676 RepID=A0A3B0Z0P3_9ZZZZ